MSKPLSEVSTLNPEKPIGNGHSQPKDYQREYVSKGRREGFKDSGRIIFTIE
jgi:hypothetical protein